MPVSALVATLSADPAAAAAAVADLEGHPCFAVGPREGRRLPLALETPDEDTNRACWRLLTEHPGVAHVDVLLVMFDPDTAELEAASSGSA